MTKIQKLETLLNEISNVAMKNLTELVNEIRTIDSFEDLREFEIILDKHNQMMVSFGVNFSKALVSLSGLKEDEKRTIN